MGHLHLVIGPVGAGKSTFARTLCREHRAVGFNLDAWMATLFGDDPRPPVGVVEWYVERRDRCLEQIWSVAQDVLALGSDAVLEVGLIQRRERDAFYRRAEGHPLTVYVLDAPREIRRARVEQRNQEQGRTFSMVVPPHVFELASDMWEPPEDDEAEGRDLRFVVDVEGEDGTISWLHRTMRG
jgi:predicted kinase